MILLTAVVAGYLVGLLFAKGKKTTWQIPEFTALWIVPVFFLPQLLVYYLPPVGSRIPDSVASLALVVSLFGLAIFSLINRRLPGMPILLAGLFLNLAVILANGGQMPISTVTAAHLLPAQTLAVHPVGSRLGTSKDVLLTPEAIVFPWLADTFTPPGWFPYRFAFSLGDVLIGMGAFLLLASMPTPQETKLESGS